MPHLGSVSKPTRELYGPDLSPRWYARVCCGTLLVRGATCWSSSSARLASSRCAVVMATLVVASVTQQRLPQPLKRLVHPSAGRALGYPQARGNFAERPISVHPLSHDLTIPWR